MTPLNVLVRHVHGSWLDAFVRGPHAYMLPLDPATGAGGKRAMWPASVVDVMPETLGGRGVDVIVAQSVGDIEAARPFLGGREPLRDVPVVFLEHNAPEGLVADMRHPLADRGDVTIVHVTHTNALFWNTGSTRTRLVEHGIPDPGYRFTAELPSAAVVINEAERRGRPVGFALLPRVAAGGAPRAPVGHGPAWRRLADARWWRRAVPAGAGVVSNDLAECCAGLRSFVADPARGRDAGEVARASVLERYGIARFVAAWNDVLTEAVG